MTATLITNSTLTTCTKRPLEDMNNNSSNKKRRVSVIKKRVHFSVFDDDDSIPPHTEIHIVPRVAPVDIPTVWYSAHEFQHARRCDSTWVKFYNTHAQLGDEYKERLFRVLGTACGKMDLDTNACHQLADAPLRGLEREMTPCFRQRKKHVVTNVLQSQKALMAWKQQQQDDDKDASKGAALLASHYEKLALPAMKFAQLLAQGDAQVVHQMMQEEDDEQR